MAEDELTKLRKEENKININISNDITGQRLQQLQDDKKRSETEFEKRRIAAERYAAIARTVDLREVPDYTAFFHQQRNLTSVADALYVKIQEKTQLRDDLVAVTQGQALDEGFLGGNLEVERARADAGILADRLHRRAMETVARKAALRGIEDAGAALLRLFLGELGHEEPIKTNDHSFCGRHR